MRKLLFCILTLILSFTLCSCLLPEGGIVGGVEDPEKGESDPEKEDPEKEDPEEEDPEKEEAAVKYERLVYEDGVDVKAIVSAIAAATGKRPTLVTDGKTAVKGEIVFGNTRRTVSTAAATLLEGLIDEKGGVPYEYSGYIIYKSTDGSVAVYWSDFTSQGVALSKFLESYTDLEAIVSAEPGVIASEVFDLSEHIYRERWSALEAEAPAELVAALKHLASNYYDGPAVVDWITGLWEPYFCACGECAEKGEEIACYGGAFYYANSARDHEGFWPDIESTGFLLNALAHSGAFEKYGSWAEAIKQVPGMSESLVRFVQALQDEETGYFYHPQWGSDIGSSRRGRDLNRANQILKALGAKPLYPTALDRLNGTASTSLTRPLSSSAVSAVSAVKATALSFESAVKNEDTYMEWLIETTKGDDMLKDSAGAHTLNSVASQIKAAGFLDITLDYLDEMMEKNYEQMKAAYDADPENSPKPTGLWQKAVDYKAVWGLIKLSSFYRDGNRPYKYPLEAMETCIKVVMFDPSVGGNYHMNDVMNQWAACDQIIVNAETHYPELLDTLYAMVRENAVQMIEQTEGKLAKFIQADGSYGYNQGTSAPTTQGVLVSLGLPEGDSNAYEMAKNTYTYIFKTLGYTAVPFCDWRDGERVLAALRGATSAVKQPQSIDPIDFDTLPQGMTTSITSSGSAEIVSDPEDEENSVLRFISKNPGGDAVQFTTSSRSSEGGCFIFDADLYVESANREYLYQITLGGSYMVDILYRGGRIKLRDNATTSSTQKVTDFDVELELSEWFNLRIEYYVDSENPTAKVYVNGELVAESHNYYGSHVDGATPKNTYTSVKFYAMNKTDATLYIDNALFYITDPTDI